MIVNEIRRQKQKKEHCQSIDESAIQMSTKMINNFKVVEKMTTKKCHTLQLNQKDLFWLVYQLQNIKKELSNDGWEVVIVFYIVCVCVSFIFCAIYNFVVVWSRTSKEFYYNAILYLVDIIGSYHNYKEVHVSTFI